MIVFMCVQNAARSQMAEALARRRFGDRIAVASAGSKPSRVNPLAIEALRAIGIDHTGESKGVDALPRDVELVVTLCADEVCPVGFGARRLHWPLPDPHDAASFGYARDAIARRLDALEPMLATPPGTSIQPAQRDDRASVVSVLTACGLPLDGLDDGFPFGYAIARRGGAIVGCAGIEYWTEETIERASDNDGPVTNHGLLRSVAVLADARGGGIGLALAADRIGWARAAKMASLHLLTAGAADLFARLGFSRVLRTDLPDALHHSTQLDIPACSTAIPMRLPM